jgi:hypothetical protein
MVGLPRLVDPLFEATDLLPVDVAGRTGKFYRFGSDFGTDLCVCVGTGEVEDLYIRVEQLDSAAFADPENWWPIIFEQLRAGLL